LKIFLDTANIEEIKEGVSWGVISGVTTNPTLACKEGRSFKELIKEISQVVEGPVSAEAVSLKAEEIIPEARELSKIAPNVVIKIPVMPEGLKATRVLSQEGIKVNMTLVFSLNQALLAAQAGAAFVSPFIGRIDDIGYDGLSVLSDIVGCYNYYGFETEVIAASIRHPLHVVEAARLGADIATVPFAVLKQMVKHPLTDIGIERFLKDWEKIKNLC